MDVDDKVLNAKEASEEDNLIRLSTGVILRGKMANIATLLTILANFPRPKAPIYHNETMGRDMENYDDPDYVSRVQAWRQEQSAALVTAFILKGTEFVEKPEKLPGHMPEYKKVKGKETKEVLRDFLEDFELLDLPMKPKSERWRYLKWVQTVACQTPDDLKLIQEVVGRLSGISKKELQAAEDFPGSEKEPG